MRKIGSALKLGVSVVIVVLLIAAWLQSDAFPTVLGINFVAYLLLMGVGAIAFLNGWIRGGS